MKYTDILINTTEIKHGELLCILSEWLTSYDTITDIIKNINEMRLDFDDVKKLFGGYGTDTPEKSCYVNFGNICVMIKKVKNEYKIDENDNCFYLPADFCDEWYPEYGLENVNINELKKEYNTLKME